MVNQYEMLEVLGKGAFGKVKKCRTPDGGIFATKQLKKSMLKRKRYGRFGNALQNVQKEIAIWKKLRHPNVVRLHEVMDDPEHDKIYLVNDFVEGGAVMPDQLHCDPMAEERAMDIFLQCLNGLEYLHAQDVVHRDLKPGNILITGGGVAKITDFGVSQFFEDGDDEVKNTVGTASFMAPEMLTPGAFKAKHVDIWAMAATLFMFVYGRPPFVEPGMQKLNDAILNKPLEFPETPATISGSLKDLLSKMMEKDPDDRIGTIDAVWQHPWCSGQAAKRLQVQPDAPALTPTEDEMMNAFHQVHTIGGLIRAKVR
eukprot:g840.t1